MLSVFLSVYPDELWYSVVSRYHRVSGNVMPATTRKELFGEPVQTRINPLGADSSIARFVALHGEGIGTVREIIEKNTLVPYHLRFYTQAQRQAHIEAYLNGEKHRNRKPFRSSEYSPAQQNLRYCPLCIRNDVEKYGESYWHRMHQIELLDKCPIHKCKLLPSTLSKIRAWTTLRCADEELCSDQSVSVDESPFDAISPYLVAALRAPFHLDEGAVLTPFRDAAISKGYLKPGRSVNAMRQLYGEMKKVLPTELLSACIAEDVSQYRLKNVFQQKMNSRPAQTETAVLLAHFLNIPPEALFFSEDTALRAIAEIRECAKKGYLWGEKQLASYLRVPVERLPVIAEKAGVAPFWDRWRAECDANVSTAIRIFMTMEERESIHCRIKQLRLPSMRAYVWWCISRDLQTLPEESFLKTPEKSP